MRKLLPTRPQPPDQGTVSLSAPAIPVFDVRIDDEDIQAVEEVLRSGWLSMGERTSAFEAMFAEHLGVEDVLAVSNCTAALHLACICAGLGPGDEVIVPSMTFVATANAVRYCGARPVLADMVSTTDLNIDPEHVESLITERTKAVIPVHYAGYSVAIAELEEICERHGLTLIEDAAHAPDATDAKGRMLGSIGMSGCFSFFPNKVLGVGEGGALATNSAEVADRVRRLRSQGMTATSLDRHLGRAMDYDVPEPGFNYRFDDIRAALITPRFRRLHGEIERRRELVHRYRSLLADVEGIELIYTDEEVDRASCYLMGVQVDPALRRSFRHYLQSEHGVQTTVYPAVHQLESYVATFGEVSLPNTERVAASLSSIPLFPHMTEAQQDQVVAAVKDAVTASEPEPASR
jgi:dTDP-4-amino-4,6-dideoxygalactose transaminase